MQDEYPSTGIYLSIYLVYLVYLSIYLYMVLYIQRLGGVTLLGAARVRISSKATAFPISAMDRKIWGTSFIRLTASSIPERLHRRACQVLVAGILSGWCWHAFPTQGFCTTPWGAHRPRVVFVGHAQANGPDGFSGLVSSIPRGVREPRRQVPDGKSPEREARMLTSRITKASSAAELLELLGKQANSKILNEYHVTAFMTALAKFKRRHQLRQADSSGPAWAQFANRLQDMLQQDLLSPRSISNTFYAMGELCEELDKSMTQVMPKLCQTVQAKAAGMEPQGLSICLLAAAKLQDVSPDVLIVVPAIAQCMPKKVHDMTPQSLSNSLWAAAKLQHASPELLDAVPALALYRRRC